MIPAPQAVRPLLQRGNMNICAVVAVVIGAALPRWGFEFRLNPIVPTLSLVFPTVNLLDGLPMGRALTWLDQPPSHRLRSMHGDSGPAERPITLLHVAIPGDDSRYHVRLIASLRV